MSSSFTYTLTKLRSLPSSVKRCLRRSPNSVVKWPRASPTVLALNSAESRFPAYGRSGDGIITFTGISFFSVVPGEISGLHCGAMASLNSLGRKPLAVVVQTPGGHVLRRAVLHAHDDVAVPRPRVVAVIFAWPRRMVGMRMVPADHFKTLLARRFFRCQDVLGSHGKAVARRIVPPIDKRKESQNLPRGRLHGASQIALQDSARITPEQRSATFVRVSLRAVCADFLR